MSATRQQFVLRFLERAPTATLSRWAGRVSRLPIPKAVRPGLWRLTARAFGMDLADVRDPLGAYRNFDELFTRRLADSARTVETDPSALASPADGVLSARGEGDQRIAVKGDLANLGSWLGVDVLPWEKPQWVVVYLSPRDYHRVHSPVMGVLERFSYRPGRLLPVNPRLVGDTGPILGQNERVVFWIRSKVGPIAVCMVGALCVGGISLTHSDLSCNRARHRVQTDLVLDSPVEVAIGDELGVFHMGSTVVLAWDGDGFAAADAMLRPGPIQYGKALGRFEFRDES